MSLSDPSAFCAGQPPAPVTDSSAPALSLSQLDRVEGVLLGQAVGDAMGAPYEPGDIPLTGHPQMLGGGYGNYAPAEWTDDTQMALYIARVSATGADLTSEAALDEIARGWCQWLVDGATDVGRQTRAVVEAVAATSDKSGIAQRMRDAAQQLHQRTGMTAGNGALMRNSIVALTRLSDRRATAASARAVAELTHADPLAGDACVIHAEMIRQNIMNPAWQNRPFHGAIPLRTLDLIPDERRTYWHDFFDGGAADPAVYLTPPTGDGFAVHALGHTTLAFTWAKRQAAADDFFSLDRTVTAAYWMDHVLMRALKASEDKDTVTAITGAVAGSYLGASALPNTWVETIHGLPGQIDQAQLRTLARSTALSGLA